MQKCLQKSSKKIEIFCLHSFKIKVFINNDQEQTDYDSIIDRFEKEARLKMYTVCSWLSEKKIDYKISFNYVKSKGINWNFRRFTNFLRLKIRLKYLNK